MSYWKDGTVEVRGKQYNYRVCQLKNGEYNCLVYDCRGACRTRSDPIEEYHIQTWIEQSLPPLPIESEETKDGKE